MLPDMAASISASLGLGFFSRSAAADMIWPDWQYPHCTTSTLSHARWILRAAFRLADRLDSRDLLADDIGDGRDAGSDWAAVEVNRTCSAKRDSAPKFGSGQPEHITKCPQEWHVIRDIERLFLAIDQQCRHLITLRMKAAVQRIITSARPGKPSRYHCQFDTNFSDNSTALPCMPSRTSLSTLNTFALGGHGLLAARAGLSLGLAKTGEHRGLREDWQGDWAFGGKGRILRGGNTT